MKTGNPDMLTHQPSILIVEDEAGPREALKTILAPYYNLYTVDRAEIALQIIGQQPIDLLTLDLKLPGQQGMDFLRDLRQQGSEVEAIIITGFGSLQSAIDAIRYGVSAYILKPFNVTELLTVVNQAMERRHQIHSLRNALQAFGHLWTSGSDIQTAIRNIEILLGAKNPDLAQHAGRVNFYASLLAEHLDLSLQQKEAIQFGAYLHDIGKIGINDRLLLGTKHPSSQDQELLQCHPILGEQMMQALPCPPDAGTIIRHHHERFDGTGYPDGLQGEQIPLLARMVGLANKFDNLVTGQSGCCGAIAIPEAREFVRREAGSEFDPTLADLFAKVVW